MTKLVVPVVVAVLVSSVAAALAGCGPSTPVQQSDVTSANAAAALNEATTTAPGETNSQTTPTHALTDQASATFSHASNLRATLTPVPTSDDGLEFLRPESSGGLSRDGGITSVEKDSSRKDRGLTGPVQGQASTWEDGDRTLTVYLQTDLVVEKDSGGFPRGIVAATDGGTSVVRSAAEQSKGDTLPVFRSESGSLMTLPGGVLLVLSADWTEAETNSFFSNNGIKMERVSELSYAANGFFIATEPGFPSLDLANELAELEGVEVSSPNWGREAVPK